MKTMYEAPKIDIFVFSTEDIITTSGGGNAILPDDEFPGGGGGNAILPDDEF